MKYILFVDDEPQILEGLKSLLRKCRTRWEMTFVASGEAALAEIAKTRFDVVVSDVRMPHMDGVTLLKTVRERHPEIVRIILSGHAEIETSLRAVPVAHQFLTKPCDAALLETVIERACNLQALIHNPFVRSTVGKIQKLPPLPKTYSRLIQALSNEGTSFKDVADILKQDLAMTAKLLQVVNSAFFRLSRRITNIEEAVSYLGTNQLKNLTLAVEVFRRPESAKNIDGLSIDQIQAHSLFTGTLASRLLTDKRQQEDAFMAGLLHDIGKVILLTELPETLAGVLAEMHLSRSPMHVTEARQFGVTHAEIGAYLLGLWGLPYVIVEAVANHHAPQGVAQTHLEVLGAVYVANHLINERLTDAAEAPFEYPPIDTEYLESIKMVERLHEWRRLVLEQTQLTGREASGIAR
jgi:putative nucleotidyltransferase with HDIG domain